MRLFSTLIPISALFFAGPALSAELQTQLPKRLETQPPQASQQSCKDLLTPQDPSTRLIKILQRLSNEQIAQLKEKEVGLEAIKNDLAESGVIEDELELKAFVSGMQLQPLFDTGIVHRAFLEELRHRGFRSKKQQRAVIRGFPLLTRFAEQVNLVEEVIKRISHVVPGQVGISDLQTIEKLAKRFKMSFEEFRSFLVQWRELEKTHFEGAKLVLFYHLLHLNPTFEQHVIASRTWGDWVSGFFARSKPPEPSPTQEAPLDVERLVDRNYEWKHLELYMRKASKEDLGHFVRSQMLTFGHHDLETILKHERKLKDADLQILKLRADQTKELARITKEATKIETEIQKIVKHADTSVEPMNDVAFGLLHQSVENLRPSNDEVSEQVQATIVDSYALLSPEQTEKLLDALVKNAQGMRPRGVSIHNSRHTYFFYRMISELLRGGWPNLSRDVFLKASHSMLHYAVAQDYEHSARLARALIRDADKIVISEKHLEKLEERYHWLGSRSEELTGKLFWNVK